MDTYCDFPKKMHMLGQEDNCKQTNKQTRAARCPTLRVENDGLVATNDPQSSGAQQEL